MTGEKEGYSKDRYDSNHFDIMSKFRYVLDQFLRPSVLYRPSLSIDGNKWCALYGSNLQDGVSGFGDSPDEAMFHFDKAWIKRL